METTGKVSLAKRRGPEYLILSCVGLNAEKTELSCVSLSNVLYKIISKMLANRMKLVLDLIISDSQSAFIPGRAITDKVIISVEIIHFLKRKRQGKYRVIALKIDMCKAYDRIEWSFLQAMMIKLGFDVKWVELIMRCVSTVQYNVLREGKVIGPIIPCRGLRQEDPLSPYLFILCAEGLSSLIRRKKRDGLLPGVKITRGALTVSHLFFADDNFFFFRANINEASLIKHLLAVYCQAFGQVVNFNKSSISFSANVLDGVIRQVCDTLMVTDTTNHGAYHGLPSYIGRKKKRKSSAIFGISSGKDFKGGVRGCSLGLVKRFYKRQWLLICLIML